MKNKFFSIIRFWISIIAVYCLMFPIFCIQSIYIVMAVIVFLGIIFSYNIYKDIQIRKDNVFGWVMSIVLGFSFFSRWYISPEMTETLEEMNIRSDNMFGIIIFSSAFAVAGAYFFCVLKNCVKSAALKFKSIETVSGGNEKINFKEIVYICLTSCVIITICSKSSFLYAFNDWQDANCFFTVGRAIAKNIVLYRDIYEQKGPYLYFLHTLASFVSDNSFIGVYIIEIVFCIAFLFIVRKILKLFVSGSVCCYIPLIASCIYASVSFCHGDSAEELCLPLLAYGLYVSVKNIKQKTDFTALECFLLGVTASCVLWIKFTMLGFYIGIICIPYLNMLKEKKFIKLFKNLGMIIIGVLVASIPVVIYFGINNAFKDLYEVYFYNNMFLYSKFESDEVVAKPLFNLFSSFNMMFSNNMIGMFFIIIGIVWLFYCEKKGLFYHLALSFLTTFFFVYIGGRTYRYYALIFGIFVVFGVIAVANYNNMAMQRKKIIKYLTNPVLALIVSAILSVLISTNTSFMSYEKEDLPQYQFAEIISEKEDATLLNYRCLDGGFYTASGILPQNKYFCRLNISLEESYREHKKYLEQGITDFIVTDKKIKSDKYELVKYSEYPEGFDLRTYYLYQLRE